MVLDRSTAGLPLPLKTGQAARTLALLVIYRSSKIYHIYRPRGSLLIMPLRVIDDTQPRAPTVGNLRAYLNTH